MRSPKRAPRGLTVSAIAALIFTVTGFTPLATVAADGDPTFTANLAYDSIDGWDWVGDVTVTIDGSGQTRTFSGDSIQYREDGSFSVALGEGENPWQLAPGQVVTVVGGDVTKMLTVANLTIDSWDFAADTLTGSSNQLYSILVEIERPGGYGVVQVDPAGGLWTANFATVHEPFDLRVMDNASATQSDEDGDATTTMRESLAGPRFVVGLVTQEIVGCGWPNGATILVTVQRQGATVFNTSTMSGGEIPETWLPLSGNCGVYFNLAAGPLLKAGDVVTMAGGGLVKTQLLPDLRVNLANEVAEELSGSTTALPTGSFLTVAADWNWTGAPAHDVTPISGGTWLTPFAGEWDIQGSSGYAVQTDVDGDQTVVTAPVPEVLTDPMADRIWAMDFAKGPVSLTITRGGIVLFTRSVPTQNVISSGWRLRDMWVQPIGTLDRPTMALFDLKGVFDIQAGDVITVGDGTSLRTFTVDNLTVDSVNAATDTVTGHATADVAFNLNDGQGFWGYGATPHNGQYSFFFDPNAFPNQGLEPGMTVIAIGAGWQTIVRYTIPGPRFSGFFSPIDNRPTVNTVKAGRAIPVKFSLGGDFGLTIFAAGYPASKKIPSSGAPTDAIEVTVDAGSSGLSYDAKTGVYTYIWKTDKAWAGTCRQLVLRLSDGTEHVADFKF